MKTLKDLEKEWKSNYGEMLLPIVNGEIELCKDLRQAAIDEIRRLENMKWYGIKNMTKEEIENYKQFTVPFLISWIIYFFNITEEGLK